MTTISDGDGDADSDGDGDDKVATDADDDGSGGCDDDDDDVDGDDDALVVMVITAVVFVGNSILTASTGQLLVPASPFLRSGAILTSSARDYMFAGIEGLVV